MKKELQKIRQEAIEKINSIKDKFSLERLESEYLGRKGKLSLALRKIKDLSGQEKREIGKTANNFKKEITKLIEEAKRSFSEQEGGQFIDPTLPGEKIEKGHLHPITQLQNDLEDTFVSMGFSVEDGPELESDYYCFESVNIPKDHPARDMQDTFYIDKKNEKGEFDLVMRTHTSSVQVRAMEKYGAPLRCVVPGKVFRSEDMDACHEHTFYQMEGLMVDKEISMSNLIELMKELLKGIFKREMEIRVRPGYFPFVEPGIEMDIKCTICGGSGCSACKNSGWLELLPAGLVHPNVLKAGGLDPKEYQGLAFGLGLTRLAMMRYGVNDIRLFNSGDLRFLKQF